MDVNGITYLGLAGGLLLWMLGIAAAVYCAAALRTAADTRKIRQAEERRARRSQTSTAVGCAWEAAYEEQKREMQERIAAKDATIEELSAEISHLRTVNRITREFAAAKNLADSKN
jgi:cation transport regulator ChaB